jgi:CRISPR-associated endonuclease Cas1
MAATKTLSQLAQSDNSLTPRLGILTLSGYGITARVDRGHLLVEDGIGADRRVGRLPRVGHGLTRLVVMGSDGMVSLAALRWLADQDAAFVMLDRNGSVLATTGPVRPSDARLRRAQALAHTSDAALRIARELIAHKLSGQENVARCKLLDSETARTIAQYRAELDSAETISAVRSIEAQAAAVYWSVWRNLVVNFPKADLRRVPEHWRTFGSRQSPLTGSCRLAANPANAILNYLYALLESEARLAVATLGLDPGLGVLHVDTPARDSLACDVMEPVRPEVDAYVLDWITRESFSRDWFFEHRDGNCRLMAPFAVRLAETARAWARAVAPHAEWTAHAFWSKTRKSERPPATRLTQGSRREARGHHPYSPVIYPPRPERLCVGCGKSISTRHTHCAHCFLPISTKSLVEAAKTGRIAAQSDVAQSSRTETQRRNATAQHAWSPATHPAWLTEEAYLKEIQPQLSRFANGVIASTLQVSMSYAADVRKGRRRPHQRHWQSLAHLVGITGNGKK